MRRIVESNTQAKLVSIAGKIHADKKFTFNSEIIEYLIAALRKNVNLAPDIKKTVSDTEAILLIWLQKIEKGFAKRISKRRSNYPGTMPDGMVSKIINARLSRLNAEDLQRINDAHRLSMSAENILGLFLEEFLFVSLKKYGWHCAWGECIRSVDFVNERACSYKSRTAATRKIVHRVKSAKVRIS